jgi:hypothetical protein
LWIRKEIMKHVILNPERGEESLRTDLARKVARDSSPLYKGSE